MKRAYRYVIYLLILISILMFVSFYKFERVTFPKRNDILAVDLIHKKDKIVQDFKVDGDDLSDFGLRFATYGLTNINGELQITIEDLDSNKIFEKNVKLADLIDNKYYSLNIPKQRDSKNKKYKLIINVLDIDKKAKVGLYGFTDESSDKLILNGKSQAKTIGIAYKCKKRNNNLYIYELFAVLFMVLIENFIAKKEK